MNVPVTCPGHIHICNLLFLIVASYISLIVFNVNQMLHSLCNDYIQSVVQIIRVIIRNPVFSMERIFRGFDPSLFGLTRMLFGGLMTIDCFVERGLQYADTKWSDSGCKFPLFNGLEQLETKLMVMLMFVQAFGALFIFLGYRVKLTG